MQKIFFLLILNVFIFFFSFNSYSFKEVYRPTSIIAKDSTEIVVARCISSEVKLDEKTGFVFTYTTFEVDKTVKNTLDTDKVELRIVGGQAGDIRTGVEGVPKFDVQEEMVLFLGPKNKLGYYTLSSFTNGIYKVDIDETTGRKIIKNPPNDLNVPNTNLKEITSGNSMLLEDFISSLKQNI
ncbi:MAG: hypothetical protein ACRENO_09635 [Thermodesulfobacteriota bacterium]